VNQTSQAVAAALNAGLEFLLKSRRPAGTWADFLLPAGQSDIWVTAYVASALAELERPAAQDAAAVAWTELQTRAGSDGGFSYNASVPGDGDSTLWGLRLARQLSCHESAVARDAARFLDAHVREDGGLATYAVADGIRRYVGIDELPFDGWLQSHACVTAAGAHLAPYRARLGAFLEHTQTPSGHWRSYWWFSDEYATSEAVTALCSASGDERRAECLARAARWAAERTARLCAGPQRPAFALALALRLLLSVPPSSLTLDARARAVGCLLEWQTETGAWPRSARLRVPRPDVTDPDVQIDRWRLWRGVPAQPLTPALVTEHTFNNYSLDYRAIFTTATVLRALSQLERGA
jgi:hypothetical protein